MSQLNHKPVIVDLFGEAYDEFFKKHPHPDGKDNGGRLAHHWRYIQLPAKKDHYWSTEPYLPVGIPVMPYRKYVAEYENKEMKKYTIKELKENKIVVHCTTNEQGNKLYNTTKTWEKGCTASFIKHIICEDFFVRIYGDEHGWNSTFDYYQKNGYIQIEFNQVIFEEETTTNMEKEKIIGYNLIKPEYEKAATQIAHGKWTDGKFTGHTPYTIGAESIAVQRLEEAGVLNLWFEPVYEEKLPNIGDYVFVKNTGGFYTTYKEAEKKYPSYDRGNSFTGVAKVVGYDTVNSNDTVLVLEQFNKTYLVSYYNTPFNKYKEYIRKATEQEIAEAKSVITFTEIGSNKLTIQVFKNGIFAKNQKIDIQQLKDILASLTTVIGPNKHLNSWEVIFEKDIQFIRIGCFTENNLFSYNELLKIVKAYENLNK